MPGFLLRGALVEYSSDFLGPIPNLVVFQFNPEELARTISIGELPTETANQRTPLTDGHSISIPPVESFTLMARFSAADDLGNGAAVSPIPRAFGVGPQIAALEKMVYPPQPLGDVADQALDAAGDAAGVEPEKKLERRIPLESLPRILFMWGATRLLPVRIQSMTITEQKFDAFLNPVQVEVQLGLDVLTLAKKSGDKIGYGALKYSRGVKEAQAILNLNLNLAKAKASAVDIIQF